MISEPKESPKSTFFHKNVYTFCSYMDKLSVKYRTVYKKYDEKKWRVDIEIDKLLDYENEEILKQEDLMLKFPEQKWSPQASGIEIKETILPELKKMWDELVKKR